MLSDLEKAILDKYGDKCIKHMSTILERLDFMVFLSCEEANLNDFLHDLVININQAMDENPL